MLQSQHSQPVHSVISPFVLRAVEFFNRGYFYMYPHLFYLKPVTQCDKRTKIKRPTLHNGANPLGWNLAPYFLSYAFLTGVLGTGGCFWVLIGRLLFGMELKTKMEPYQLHLVAMFALIAVWQWMSYFLHFLYPGVHRSENKIFDHEHKCSFI